MDLARQQWPQGIKHPQHGLYGLSGALAQDSAEASASGDIIVTARRSEERLQDVPISITVLDQDTPSTLHERIQLAERRLYPECIAALARGSVRVEGRRVTGFTPSDSPFSS